MVYYIKTEMKGADIFMDISVTEIITVIITFCVSFILPTSLILFYRKKTKTDIFPAITSVVLYIIFGVIIRYFLDILLGKFVSNQLILSILSFGVVSAILQETSRFFGFKILRAYDKIDGVGSGIMYGMGQGMISTMTAVGLPYLGRVIVLIAGAFGDDVDNISPKFLRGYLADQNTKMLATLPYETVLTSAICISILIIEICLSVVMWDAATTKGRGYLYPVSILIHVVIAIPVVLFSKGLITANLFLPTIILFICALLLIFFSYSVFESTKNRRIFGRY